MQGLLPYGGMTIVGGAGTVALTTTPALMNLWSASGGADSASSTLGDPAVRIDRTNNRLLLNSPGVYLVTLDLSGTVTTGCDLVVQPRKNGTTDTRKRKMRFTTNKAQISCHWMIVVNRSDSPSSIQTFADPSSTGFAGAGGAPKTEVPFDIVVSCAASTDTLTVEEAELNAVRVG